jgi:hypothetical protein
VTATETITKDVFIEKVSHTITPNLVWSTTYQVSPIDPVLYWILDTSLLDSTTVLGF